VIPPPIRTPLLRSLPWLAVAAVLAAGAHAQQSCTAAGCHDALLARPYVHAAADGDACDSCHQSTATPHPQKGTKTFALTQQPPALCADCHDAAGTKKHVHPPLAEGDCTTCHDPHASSEAKLLTEPLGELCGLCHGDVAAAPLLHGPVAAGDCTSCHAAHESDAPKLLVEAGDGVCFDCHSDMEGLAKQKVVHAAVEAGCTSCHQPHGAAHPKLLAEEGGALCFQCHGDVEAAVAKATVPHAPLGSAQACASCHTPHAGEHAKLLPASERDTCLGCHAGVIDERMTTLHAPIRDGSCTACHAPHGGDNAKLLAGRFPAKPYVAYSEGEYELCFQCHDADLAKFPDTAFATGFRDGERNLHYVHVNAEKGRSCSMCHDLHGSDNPSLIASSVPFGQWRLPLRFTKTETGGGCSPGCHRPYGYDRKSPVKGGPPAAAAVAGKAD
jgi:predicted CXXCH cytochrome family protein